MTDGADLIRRLRDSACGCEAQFARDWADVMREAADRLQAREPAQTWQPTDVEAPDRVSVWGWWDKYPHEGVRLVYRFTSRDKWLWRDVRDHRVVQTPSHWCAAQLPDPPVSTSAQEGAPRP